MASSTNWLARLAETVGPTERPRPLGGGTGGRGGPWVVNAGGRVLVAKLGPGVLDEADGLARLRHIPGAPPVPEVVLAQDDLLVTVWVEQGPAVPEHHASLGRSLAALHRAPFPHWGGGSSWIGAARIDPSPFPDAVGFYGARLADLSERCGLERPVAAVVDRLAELLPADHPALLHGDLWWGNVLFGADGQTWLIDPSVHGGYPEEDLAMLALFGAIPDRTLRAYHEVRPLGSGWEERIGLFQLYPLLVHAVLFGGRYRSRVETVAARYI